MILKEKERTTIQDLQTQEKSCIEKYGRYAQQAKDPELKNLFQTLQQKEREHYDSLERVLNGEVPQCNCNDSDGRDYQPKATYTAMSSPEDKQQDAFLATDCIATEKLVSGEYNSEVFAFGDSGVRKLLADIQVEEQNHAEMLYKYKTVENGTAGFLSILLYFRIIFFKEWNREGFHCFPEVLCISRSIERQAGEITAGEITKDCLCKRNLVFLHQSVEPFSSLKILRSVVFRISHSISPACI